MSRNVRRANELKCRYEWCGKECKSRAGLTMHEKRMHRVVKERVQFECSKCGRECDTQGAKRIMKERVEVHEERVRTVMNG